MSTLKYVFGGAILIALFAIFYPDKAGEIKESLETTGSVAVDKALSSLEDKVGKADITIKRYENIKEAKKKALIDLKTLKKDVDRKAGEAAVAAAEFRQQGNEVQALKKDAEKAEYENQSKELAVSEKKAEEDYLKFKEEFEQKKNEIKALQVKTEMLRKELAAMNGGSEEESLQKARAMEEEVKSTCARLEAEIEVKQLDNEN